MNEILRLPIRPLPSRPRRVRPLLPRALRIWIPVAATATALAGLAYVTAEQVSYQDRVALAGTPLRLMGQPDNVLQLVALAGWLAALAMTALATLAATAYLRRLELDLGA